MYRVSTYSKAQPKKRAPVINLSDSEDGSDC